MLRLRAFVWVLGIGLWALSVGARAAAAQNEPGFPRPSYDMMEPGTLATARLPQFEDVTFKQRLNTKLPLDAPFKDENGRPVTLARLFGGEKPVVLAFVYYSCPMLCTQVMNGVSRAVKVLPFSAGKDFDVVFISFDPRDKPETASAKKTALMNYWSMQNQSGAWHFLTGEAPQIKEVTSAAGFFYTWDEKTRQFAHMSGVLVLTPDGRLSRYFYGIEYSPKELRLALVESGQGHIGSIVDELLLYCYHYDPASGRYGAMVMNLVRIGGVLTVLLMGGFILLMRRQEKMHPPSGGPRVAFLMQSGFSLFPPQASTLAPEVDNLYLGVVAITAFFALVVVIFVVYFAIKYRDDTGDKIGAPITGSVPLELGWSLIPFVISIGIFVWASIVFFHIVRAPDQTLEIYSTGKRWMWRFQHIDGQREINELHVPLGRPVRVVFTSEDVLHDLFIPAFRVKADAVPGRYSAIWFEATKVGEYHLFCAEDRGTRHSGMIGTVYVMEPADYQAWLSGGGTATAGGSMAQQGEQLFTQLACVTCHLPDGTGRGPSLVGVYGSTVMLANGMTVTADESYLRESILTSQAKTVAGYQQLMPTFQGLVNEDGVASLIEYIKSMTGGARAATTQAAP